MYKETVAFLDGDHFHMIIPSKQSPCQNQQKVVFPPFLGIVHNMILMGNVEQYVE